MPKRKPTFADYGRLGGLKGGKSTSDAKVAAARKNGQKGGWPKGKRRNQLSRAETAALVRGLEDVKAGRVKPLDQVRAKLAKGKRRKGKG